MNTCLVWGSSCRMSSIDSRKVVDDRDGGLVVPKRRVAEIPLIDGREQERRVGKELLSILAREDRRGAGDRHDQVRLGTIGEDGSDVVDDRLFRRADKPCRTHDDLDDVHGSARALVQFDAEVAGELVDDQVAAVERLQHQDLPDRGLSSLDAAASSSKTSQRGDSENLLAAPVLNTSVAMGPDTSFAPVQDDIHLPHRTMKFVAGRGLVLSCAAASARRAAHGSGGRVGRRPDRCPAARRSRDDSRCRRPHGGNRRRRRLRVSGPSGRRLRDFRGTERLRAGASCRARAGGRTGHRVLHLARRPRGRDDRHGRQDGRARCSRDSHGDQCRLASRSRPPGNPDHRAGAGAGPLGDVFAEHRLGPAHDPRDRRQRCCSPDRIPVRRCISTASTSPGRRWCSRSFSIWIASKCFVGRRARCMDATRSAGR